MLALILIFVFAVLALLALGARSFTRLVELILSNGSKVAALAQEVQQVRTTLSNATAASTDLHRKVDSLITQGEVSTSLTESIETPKSHKSS